MATKSESGERSVLDRMLGLFAEVRAGEGLTAVLLTLNVFLLLTCYYLLKTAREPLILASGAEVKSYSSAGQALILIPATYIYGRVAERVGRMRLIAIVTIFFASNLVLFFIAGKAHVPHLGVAFFLWVGVFNMMIIAQFWSFSADIYGPEQGKRLFAILGIGSTVGAVAGSGIARALFKTVGAFGLMLAAAGFLLLALSVTATVNAREKRKDDAKKEPRKDEPLGKGGGFAMLIRDRYLMLLAALSFVLNWVNTSGEYILDRALLEVAKVQLPPGVDAAVWTERFIGEYKANYFLWVNVVSVVMQLFVVSRIIKYLGVRFALLMVPIISLSGYCTLIFYPALSIILIVKIAENSLDYSLQNTSRQALWLVTSRESKYKAKSVIDTFIVRAGDLLSATVTAIGAALHFATVHFIMINAALVTCWLTVVVLLTRQYKAKIGASGAPDAQPLRTVTA
ncbi:MAG: MFS transporter [Myxococcota bacterium]|nr:MFS transporter [Myxococcota bacterium]